MLTPKTIHDDLHEHHTQVVQLFKQLALQQVDKVQSAVTSQHPSLRQLFKQIRSHH